MTLKGTAWLGMTVLAFAVAGYAAALLVAPDFRTSFAQNLFSEKPAATLAHLAASAIALAVGGFQVSARLRVRYLGAHRWLGRLYVIAVAVGGVAAFALALRAFGGLVTQVAFGLLAVCWVGSTINGYLHIRSGNQDAHREWMVRSYALTFAAVTLRLYLPAGELAGLSFESTYRAVSWLCWVPNLIVVEWFIRRNRHRAVSLARQSGARAYSP